jgi:protein phosphatase
LSIEKSQEPDIARLFGEAQERLKLIASEKPDLADMGTTLSVISISNKIANVGHVGDSRIYHLRSEGIVDRTVDQTEVEQLVQQRVLSKASARRYPRRHVLLSVLSGNRDYELHREQFDIQEGDRLLLLTDGVSSKVLRQEIRDMSRQHSDTKSFCAALADEIEKRMPQDDYSAICLDIRP